MVAAPSVSASSAVVDIVVTAAASFSVSSASSFTVVATSAATAIFMQIMKCCKRK